MTGGGLCVYWMLKQIGAKFIVFAMLEEKCDAKLECQYKMLKA